MTYARRTPILALSDYAFVGHRAAFPSHDRAFGGSVFSDNGTLNSLQLNAKVAAAGLDCIAITGGFVSEALS